MGLHGNRQAASSLLLGNFASARSPAPKVLFNHLLNNHFLVTKKATLVFQDFISVHAITLPGNSYCGYSFCRGCMCTSKLEKALSLMGTKWWRSHLLRVTASSRVYNLFLAKRQDTITLFSTLFLW